MANNLTNPEYFDMAGVVYEISQRDKQRGFYSEAARVYADRYPERYHPDRRFFARIHGNAFAYGNFAGPPRNARPRENPNTDAILAAVAANPQTSTRTIIGDLDISKTAVHNVLKKNEYKPYKIHIH